MDLSVLYFFFPRLAESRKPLWRNVTLSEDQSCGYVAHEWFPRLRDKQVLRVLPAPEFSDDANKHAICVRGIGEDGEEVPFHWACTTRYGHEYAPAVATNLIGFEITSKTPMVAKRIDWVSISRTK